MKKLSIFCVVMAMFFSLGPVSAMSIDQNCTMVIELHDGRTPVTIPTDQIRSITFRPIFSGTAEPTIKAGPPANSQPTPSKTGSSDQGLRGTWSGKYTNTRNEPGTEEITLVETGGKVEGTEGGLKILDGKRNGNTMTWRLESGGGFAKGGCTWNVTVEIQESGNMLFVKYAGHDHRTNKNDGGYYSGEAKVQKIR